MFRATNSPILRSTFWLYIELLVQCTDTAADRCHGSDAGRQQCRCIVPKAVYTVKKCSWGWANLSPETCRAELKKINKRKSFGILLVIYIVVQKSYGYTINNAASYTRTLTEGWTKGQAERRVEESGLHMTRFLCFKETPTFSQKQFTYTKILQNIIKPYE